MVFQDKSLSVALKLKMQRARLKGSISERWRVLSPKPVPRGFPFHTLLCWSFCKQLVCLISFYAIKFRACSVPF